MGNKNRQTITQFPVKVNAETRKARQERMAKSLLGKFIALFNEFGKEEAWAKIVKEPEAQSPVAMVALKNTLPQNCK